MEQSLTIKQFTLLIFTFTIGSSLLIAPAMVSVEANQDAWISMAIATGCGLLLNGVWLFLLSKYHYLSIYSVVEKVCGKWIGTILNLLLVFYSSYICALVVRDISDFLITYMIEETHPWLSQSMILLLVVYSASKGLTNIGRVNEFMTPLLVFAFLGGTALLLDKIDLSNLQPVLEQGWSPVWKGTYAPIGFPFLEVLVLSALITYVKPTKKVVRSFFVGLFFAGVILIIAVIAAIGEEGAFMIQRYTFPTYTVMRDISIGRVFERTEVFFGLLFMVGIFVKITICFLVGCHGLQHISKRSNYHAILIPLAVWIWAMSNFLNENIVEVIYFASTVWTLVAFTMYVIIVCILLWGIGRKKHQQKVSIRSK
ncbi:endospore germination permease [Mechercharimyces sp. CAU 1602]|uniref:GerAB/ArcD/ProY family transporter n=1 Tax=Mechercharimyces sp. CAU 1602 TaxID=2973933 RepID=UPI0021612BD5|nr:endospore germination permease [Mechercharimyces sp. CAU 1602]MCS1351415.1 endospore germination permease [Mechercharimyces sp. CAU 1602]